MDAKLERRLRGLLGSCSHGSGRCRSAPAGRAAPTPRATPTGAGWAFTAGASGDRRVARVAHRGSARALLERVRPGWRARGPFGPWRSWYADLTAPHARLYVLVEAP